jgi:hypothetical protein
MSSNKWQHATHGCHIGFVHTRWRTQLAFTLAALFCQDVTQVRLAALEPARPGLLEALCSTPVSL